MLTYQKTIEIVQDDLDELNHVNNIRYVQWIQEISKEHWEHNIPPSIQDNYIWVVRNHNINYLHSAILGDTIAVKTKVLDWKGPISTRQVEMKNNKTLQLLVKATTEWCLLNPKSGKPMRVPDDIIRLFCKDL